MELNNQQLNKIKEVELEILIEIDRLCRKHNIKYSLTFGTLIGAIRHKGFIPWDDDVDIIMNRVEFDKFKSVLKELKDDYYYVDPYTDRRYGLFFPKIMKKNTLMKEVTNPKRVNYGIFVDIFVVEKTSVDPEEQLKQFNRYWFLRRIYLRKKFYNFKHNKISAFIYKVCGVLLKPFSSKSVRKKLKANSDKFLKSKDYKWILFEIDDKDFSKAIYDRELYEEYIDIEFEKHTFMAIKNYDSFLKSIYGDYMSLPSEEDRVPHHFIKALEFGDEK